MTMHTLPVGTLGGAPTAVLGMAPAAASPAVPTAASESVPAPASPVAGEPQGARSLVHLAEVAKALGNPQRMLLLEQLAAGELPVEQLAGLAQLSVANASQHLQTLKRAGLVASRKNGKQVLYRLGPGPLLEMLAALRDYADFQHAALRQTLTDTAQTRLPLQAITMQELQRRIQDEGVVLVDVRPQAEFAQGHIPGALNIPVAQLQQHLGSLPAQTGIVAYCRDPFCISSTQAVELLQAQGFQAQRLIGGVPEWAALGGDVAQGVEPASASGPAALDR